MAGRKMKTEIIVRTLRIACWLSCLTAPLALPLAGCKRAPPPPPAPAPAPSSTSWVQSVRKLDGAPARVFGTQFAPDGASLLVLEGRPPKEEGVGEPITYAISRRPIAGGAATDLVASTTMVLDFEPLGDGVVAMQRPQVPPPSVDAPDDDASERRDQRYAAMDKQALYRIGDGGPPVRVSPEGRRCLNVIGAAGGQWVAFSVAPEKRRYDEPYDAGIEIHVLGAKPGEETTLSIKGLARDLSPDGAWVIVRRPPEVPDGGAPKSLDEIMKRPLPRDIVKALVMVSVKDQAVTELPASLQVDGTAVDTAKFFVSFCGEGLIFRSDEGELYRSALDGSNATRLAGPLPDAADAGAPTDAGEPAAADAGEPVDAGEPAAADAGEPVDAGEPAAQTKRVLGPKGTLFVLHEEAGAVVLSRPNKGGVDEPIAKLEGPIAALGQVVLDADEKRVALAVLSDTSRNGSFDAAYDDAVLFVTDAAPGSLSFGRAPVALLADEIRLKVAAATGVPASAVAIVAEDGSVKATAELPWIDGEKAKALLDRAFVAARALGGAVTQRDVSLHLRVGQLDLAVVRRRDGDSRPYVELVGRGLWFSDPEALPLMLLNPVRTSLYTSSNQTLSGTLENTGSEPTASIEVFTRVAKGYGESRTYREITKMIGSIAPGKRAKFNLIVTDASYSDAPNSRFRADGKPLAVFNQYVFNHSFNWLETALAVRAAHGAWSEHAARSNDYRRSLGPVLVHLTAEQAVLPDGDRQKLFQEIAKAVYEHHRRFHQDDALATAFAAPGGGGWLLETGKKIQRFEGKEP